MWLVNLIPNLWISKVIHVSTVLPFTYQRYYFLRINGTTLYRTSTDKYKQLQVTITSG